MTDSTEKEWMRYQVGESGTTDATGWTCHHCGTFVRLFERHDCPVKQEDEPESYTLEVVPSYSTQLNRIIDLLGEVVSRLSIIQDNTDRLAQ